MTSPPDPALHRIGQIALRARDIERATAFYRDVLGLHYLFSAPPGLAFFMCGDVRLMLGVSESAEHDHPASVLYYTVSQIATAHATLQARGAVFVQEPHIVHRAESYDLWMAFLKDSEGNTLALMEERAR